MCRFTRVGFPVRTAGANSPSYATSPARSEATRCAACSRTVAHVTFLALQAIGAVAILRSTEGPFLS